MNSLVHQDVLKSFQVIVEASKKGDIQSALTACEQVLKNDDKQTRVLFLAIGFATTLGQLDKAINWLEKISQLSPSHPDLAKLYFNLASAHLSATKNSDALYGFIKAGQVDPSMAAAFFYQGIVLEHLGRMDDAGHAFKKAIDVDGNYFEAWRKFVAHKKFDKPGDEQHALELALANTEINVDQKLHLHFALYKIFQDQNLYDQAFSHLKSANDLKHQSLNYDVQNDVDYMERIICMFDQPLVGKITAGSRSTATPVFIVGLPRSGSTLIEQILSRHPAIDGAGEIGLLEKLIIDCGLDHSQTRQFPECMADIDHDAVHDIAENYIKSLSSHGWNGDLVVNKTLANFLYIPLILSIFPKAIIIHSVRHPVATGFSCYQRLFQNTGPKFVYHQQDIVDYVTAYQNMMSHWHDLFPGRILDVKYENVVADLPAQAKRLIEFCKVDWHADCTDFHNSTRNVMTASNIQVRQPVYSTAVDFWQNYKQHLGPLQKLK